MERLARASQRLPPHPSRGKPSPFALVAAGPKGLRLVACDVPALELGLRPGQRLADAQARVPHLDTSLHAPEKDASALLHLVSWTERWSPWVAPAPPDGLFLDVSGIAHLFGSEARLIADMQSRFLALGYTARFGIAGTIGAAWALARYAPSPASAASSPGWREALAGLPVEALRLELATATTLRRLGLKTIGQLCAIPRRSLARRFHGASQAEQVVLRLDQAFGILDEPLSPLRDPPQFSVRQNLEEPLSSAEGINAMLDDLAEKLCHRLEQTGEGAARLVLALFRSDGSRATVKAGLSRPSRNPVHISRLLKPKLDGLDAGFGIDAMSLTAEETGRIEVGDPGFLAAPDLAEGFAELSDRIANRYGEAHIARLLGLERHWPEWAERSIPPASSLPSQTGDLHRTRPLTLFDRPEEISVMAEVPDGPPVRFAWRRVRHRVRRCEGPERIAPEWWRGSEKTRRPRDYYVVEDDEGCRFWLFREGVYGEDLKPSPRWFLHGLLP
ncbi:MAG: DNA polymerase Y family protein [Pseudomonadota bacterium]|nr:DNA polymerase Y family protein [Pseudomonadota bacterium]